jgi:flavin-dependent dehydrogenase
MSRSDNFREIIRIIGGGPAGMMAALELSKLHEEKHWDANFWLLAKVALI